MSGQILTEEELNAVGIMVGGLLNEGNINLRQSSMIESVFLSHDAQTEYIEAQDKAGIQLMTENMKLIEKDKKVTEFMDWAKRIIDSGMGAGILKYNPVQFFIEYHTYLKSLEVPK